MGSAVRTLVLARQVRKRLAAVAGQVGLSEAEAELLWGCAQAPPGGRSQTALARDLAVSPGHVSAVIESLGRAGLLQCSMPEGDRRVRMWELAPVGRAVLEALLAGLAPCKEAA
jgi:DNA-binding MarR family transcriptional regulator